METDITEADSYLTLAKPTAGGGQETKRHPASDTKGQCEQPPTQATVPQLKSRLGSTACPRLQISKHAFQHAQGLALKQQT